MKCSDARARLSAYLDSELDAGSTFEVSRHIRSCPECAARFEEERRVDEAIGARLRGETLPDEAWTTIRLAVGASTRRPSSPMSSPPTRPSGPTPSSTPRRAPSSLSNP